MQNKKYLYFPIQKSANITSRILSELTLPETNPISLTAFLKWCAQMTKADNSCDSLAMMTRTIDTDKSICTPINSYIVKWPF